MCVVGVQSASPPPLAPSHANLVLRRQQSGKSKSTESREALSTSLAAAQGPLREAHREADRLSTSKPVHRTRGLFSPVFRGGSYARLCTLGLVFGPPRTLPSSSTPPSLPFLRLALPVSPPPSFPASPFLHLCFSKSPSSISRSPPSHVQSKLTVAEAAQHSGYSVFRFHGAFAHLCACACVQSRFTSLFLGKDCTRPCAGQQPQQRRQPHSAREEGATTSTAAFTFFSWCLSSAKADSRAPYTLTRILPDDRVKEEKKVCAALLSLPFALHFFSR